MPFSCSKPQPWHRHSRKPGTQNTLHSTFTHKTPEPCSMTPRGSSPQNKDDRYRVRQRSRKPRHGQTRRPAEAGTPSRPARPEAYQNLIHTSKDHDDDPARTASQRTPSQTTELFPPRTCTANQADTNQPAMEAIGFEPTTPCLQSRCSPS